MARTAIWINEGCIQCFWCQNLEPEVFSVTADGCEIRAEARTDRRANPNRSEHASLNDGLVTEENIGFVQFVADGCPAHVIMIETDIQIEAPL
jgi:ferredoxin